MSADPAAARRPAIVAVDDEPAVLAALPHDVSRVRPPPPQT